MARPQLEDGHTKIANEILDHFITLHLSPNQWQILFCIIRKTYGYHKKSDYIANCQIIDATGLGKEVVSRAIKEMSERNIITRNGKYIGFQKDWELWKELAISSTIVSNSDNYKDSEKLAGTSTKVSNIVNQEEPCKLAISSTIVSNSDNYKDSEKLAILQPELAISSSELAKTSTKVSSPLDTQNNNTITKDTITKDIIEKTNNKPEKKIYGEFKNVLLTDEEYQKLEKRFNGTTKTKIENLSSGIESHGYKYKSHYATILNWALRDEKKNGNKKVVIDGQSSEGNPWANN